MFDHSLVSRRHLNSSPGRGTCTRCGSAIQAGPLRLSDLSEIRTRLEIIIILIQIQNSY